MLTTRSLDIRYVRQDSSGFLGLIDGPIVDYLGYTALRHAPPDSKVSVGPEEFLELV